MTDVNCKLHKIWKYKIRPPTWNHQVTTPRRPASDIHQQKASDPGSPQDRDAPSPSTGFTISKEDRGIIHSTHPPFSGGCRLPGCDHRTGVYRITHIPICKRLSRRDLMQTQFHNPLLVQLLPVPTLARGVYSSFSDFGKRLRRRHLLPLWNAPNGSTRSVPAGSLSAPVWQRRGWIVNDTLNSSIPFQSVPN